MTVHVTRAGIGAKAGRTVSFSAADGFPLEGTLFQGDGSGPLVLISSASAVPRGLYAGFAAASVAAGARAALVYDYRGTGGSRRPRGWKGRIGMKDWAVRDLPTAVKTLDAVAPGHPMVGVGQSYGGQALGLCGVSDRFLRYGMVAAMSGYFGGLDDPRVPWLMLGIGVPASLVWPSIPRWLGIGEPVPSSVFRDWARWCASPDYFFGDPRVPEAARFAEVATPILAIGLDDDAWGTRRAVRALTRRYANAPVEERWISPEEAGGPIGHLGYFRSRFAATLWPDLIGWLIDGRPATLGRSS